MLFALALFACAAEPPATLTPAATTAPRAQAALPLKLTSGSIELVQVKNGAAEVPAKFTDPTGTLSADGTDSFEIDLSTWDSEMEVRDARVRETFFHATEHPKATFEATSLTSADPSLPLDSTLPVDATRAGVLKGELSLYSGKAQVEIPVSLSRPSLSEYHLNTEGAFQVSIESLGLNENLQALIVECAHESVHDSADGSFNLIFTQKIMATLTTFACIAPLVLPIGLGLAVKIGMNQGKRVKARVAELAQILADAGYTKAPV
ncbi:MAG: hypothetical protein ACI8S6_005925 [Myxococcota bacterium]|jgi:hypothetical protein